jgi:hypothetical protein
MTFKRAVYASTLAAGVGLAGLFGVGLGTAAADPGQCNAPNRPPCGQDQHGDDRGHDNNDRGRNDNNQWNNNGPVDWHNRGIDEGRRDHQPFNWNGQQVYPVPAGNGQGWGFWLGPLWIAL